MTGKYVVHPEISVGNCGQKQIGTRWVIIPKEKSDGQKSQSKGHLVAKGFQEEEKPVRSTKTIEGLLENVFCSGS